MRMSIRERNKMIKKLLAKEFGYKNVRVRGDRGTAYGWVDVYVKVPKRHSGNCDVLCYQCRKEREEVRNRVWKILDEHGLTDELGVWYDDMGYKHYEIIIDVELDENMREEKREKQVINNGDNYTVFYEGSWTWIEFKKKPSEEVRTKLKEQGFRFSKRRMAWYKPEKVNVTIN